MPWINTTDTRPRDGSLTHRVLSIECLAPYVRVHIASIHTPFHTGLARRQAGRGNGGQTRSADHEAGGTSNGIADAFGRSANSKGLDVEGKTRAAPAGIPNGGTMSGHGKRETILRANAMRWRDRVC